MNRLGTEHHELIKKVLKNHKILEYLSLDVEQKPTITIFHLSFLAVPKKQKRSK